MAGALEQIALDLIGRRPGDRFLMRQVLRDYIRTHSTEEVVAQIMLLDNERIAGVLLAAGLNEPMQDALVMRVKELRAQ